jgi:ubiquinone/menaquinone biosynthesis C-methylase UbiE
MMKFIKGARIPLSEESFVNANIAQFYDEHARRFMGPVYRRFAAKAAGISHAGNQVLDIGTGAGQLAIELSRVHSDWEITGIDISEDMLKLARHNATQRSLADRIDFRQASAAALPFADGYFALVTSNASFHLWTDPLKVFKEIARVTSPGGYCLIWDNLRLTMLSPFLSLLGRAMGMNASQCRLWMQAIHSSYTIGEVKAILRESALKDARLKIYPGFFELGIEWRKPVEETYYAESDSTQSPLK